MNKKVIDALCKAIISVLVLILTFLGLHVLLIGPVASGSFKVYGMHSRVISDDELNSGLTNMSRNGNYLYSVTDDPQIMIGISDNEIKYKYIRFDIENLSEENSVMQIFFCKNGELYSKQSLKIKQGVNIINLSQQDFDTLRLDPAGAANVYFYINSLVFTDNYFLALPGYFWLIYLLTNAAVFLCGTLIRRESLSRSADKLIDRAANSSFVKELKKAVSSHSSAAAAGGFIVLAIFGYEIFNFTIGVDEERDLSHSYGTTTDIERVIFKEGRYGQYLYRLLFTYDRSTNPYFDVFFGAVLLFLAALMTAICLEKYYGRPFSNASVTIFIGAFVSLPYIVPEWFCYNGMNVCFSAALLLCALSAYLITFSGHRASRYSLCTLMLVLAFSMSENFLAYFIALACSCVFFSIFGNENSGIKEFFGRAVPLISVFGAGFVIYMLMRAVIGTNSYAVNTYFHWGNQSFSEIAHNLKAFMIKLFDSSVPGSKTAAVSAMCFVFMTAVAALEKRSLKRFFMTVLCAVCCVLGVFSLNIVTGGGTPYRTMLTLMLFTSIPWIMAVEFFGKYGKAVRLFPIAAASLIIIQQGITVTRVFYGANECSRLDAELGYDIGTQVSSIDASADKPVVIIGRYQHPSPLVIKIDAVGQSVFYRGKTTYLLNYLRLLGFDFIQPDADTMTEAETLAADMPTYPTQDSIKEFDDMIIVKLS